MQTVNYLKMNTKAKGTGAERELIHLFWMNSWAAVRVAGSGSMKYPSPDVLASNNKRKLGIECKASKGKYQYLTKEEVKQLKEFCSSFGSEPWIGIRFGREWYFLSLDDLKETSKSFVVSNELAKQKGLTFNELIGFV
jgi:Holliday junction resolvase